MRREPRAWGAQRTDRYRRFLLEEWTRRMGCLRAFHPPARETVVVP